ncbi:MAG TPA: hypothetical protein PLD66_08980, partial [Accumulibacter sp.]|nr:hypothetical protein [Accumulibacter sp.]
MNYKAQKIDFSLFFDQRPPLDHARLRHPLRGAVFDVAAGAMTGYKVWLSRGCPFRQSVQTFSLRLLAMRPMSRGCPFRQSVQTSSTASQPAAFICHAAAHFGSRFRLVSYPG